MELIITLLITGFILLLLETILPGMIAGIIGFSCIIIATIMSYSKFGIQTGNTILVCVLIILTIGTMAWIKFFPKSWIAKFFISNQTVGELNVEKPELIGKEGVALSNLRPSGMAMIDGKRVDVVTEGGIIEKGKKIKVVAVEGLCVIVREV